MSAPESSPARPREGWILAGALDGATTPDLHENLGGIPFGMRHVLDLALAGASQVYVIWAGTAPAPDLSAITSDPRVASRVKVHVVTEPPPGSDDEPVVLVRADRVFHRDVPKLVAHAYRRGAALARIDAPGYDGAFATTRAHARTLAQGAEAPGHIAATVGALAAAGNVVNVEAPYMGFTTPVHDRAELRRAERTLVRSLRKAADGIASKAINRSLSLPISRLLCRTPVMPNHVTLVALVCALAGGYVIARGGYWAGALGMLLVELGSIIDGIDGELARLRFQFSRGGQWLDTIVDDIANVAYSSGVIVSLNAAGATWAVPVGIAAICCFILTQSSQYALIKFVYKSGDLAAIPWAFQSAEFLSQRPKGFIPWVKATVPKMLKRDFVVTMFFVSALLGRLEPILLVFSGGAFVFFVVFFVQFARNVGDVRRAAAAK